MPNSHTFTFVKRGDLEVKVDVLTPTQPKQNPAPLLVWYHGGGLLQGNRSSIAPHHLRAVDDLGVILVSPDYRLAPQTRVPEMQQDFVALTHWVQQDLATALQSSQDTIVPDLDRIAVSGSSAGGWIAFWIGLGMIDGITPQFQSAIRAIAPIYPITTMDHPFFADKQVPFMGHLDVPSHQFDIYKDPSAPTIANTADVQLRNKLYMHAQQEALFPQLLFSPQQIKDGWLQKSDVAVFIKQADSQNRAQWPPIYIIHGTLDTAVGVDQARRVHTALQAVGHNEVMYQEPSDKDHLYDFLEPQEQMQHYWRFLKQHLVL
ncbi:unnamed protein product [Sympodiomycopsis kandeliae]